MKHVVVIGGGTGTFTVLSGLKKHPISLSAIVSMADDGGSTGRLRSELGVLPPGDVRQCLIALSESDVLMRELMNYRFENGSLKGHNFGNILLSSLEKTTGSFDAAVSKMSEILRLRGTVIPVTLQNTRLLVELKNKKIIVGEEKIGHSDLRNIRRIGLLPRARANKKALDTIKHADLIIIGPGDIYRSIIPNLLVSGIRQALRNAKAKKIFVCNLVAYSNHTGGWDVKKFSEVIEEYIDTRLDYIIYNTKPPTKAQLKRYARVGETPVKVPKKLSSRFIGAPLVRNSFGTQRKGDLIVRTLIRHDSNTLAKILLSLL